MKFLTNKLWRESILFGIAIITGAVIYNGIRAGAFTLSQFNISLAFAGIIMVTLSHTLSGTAYFWGWGKSKLGYRKMIGVVGFFIILFHATLATWLYTGSYVWITYVQNNPKAGIPAILAILIMVFMVIISNWGMPKRIGAKRWRQLLRIGYLVIILGVIHFFQLSVKGWMYWMENLKPVLPPLSLFAFIVAVFTLLLRIALWIALMNKKEPSNDTNPTPQNQQTASNPPQQANSQQT